MSKGPPACQLTMEGWRKVLINGGNYAGKSRGGTFEFFFHYRHHHGDWGCSGVHCDQTGSSGCSMRFIQKAFMSPPLPFMPSVISIIIIIVIIIISCGDDQTMIMILTIMLTPNHGCKQGLSCLRAIEAEGRVGGWELDRALISICRNFVPPVENFVPPVDNFAPGWTPNEKLMTTAPINNFVLSVW